VVHNHHKALRPEDNGWEVLGIEAEADKHKRPSKAAYRSADRV
jgi:hypothetical protein